MELASMGLIEKATNAALLRDEEWQQVNGGSMRPYSSERLLEEEDRLKVKRSTCIERLLIED